VAVTEVMHDPHRVDIEERREQHGVTRAAPCLVCGEWIEARAPDSYRVLVSNPPREAEYACHEICFERVRHASVAKPA
jgi:hypothetical protein